MIYTRTARGFALIHFQDYYGATIDIQKSSLATADCIWFGPSSADPKIMASKAQAHGVETEEACGWVPFPIPDDVLLTTRAHLSREMVAELIPILQHFVDTGTLPVTNKEKPANEQRF